MGLIPGVIQHAHKTKARGTLIVPDLPSTPLWPILFPGHCRIGDEGLSAAED